MRRFYDGFQKPQQKNLRENIVRACWAHRVFIVGATRDKITLDSPSIPLASLTHAKQVIPNEIFFLISYLSLQTFHAWREVERYSGNKLHRCIIT
jgi:hypothetical protein